MEMLNDIYSFWFFDINLFCHNLHFKVNKIWPVSQAVASYKGPKSNNIFLYVRKKWCKFYDEFRHFFVIVYTQIRIYNPSEIVVQDYLICYSQLCDRGAYCLPPPLANIGWMEKTITRNHFLQIDPHFPNGEEISSGLSWYKIYLYI